MPAPEEELMALVAQAEDDDPAVALRAAAELRRAAERLEAAQVRRARLRGLSWEDIAGALGVTRQAVHKKHAGSRLRGRA